MRSNIPILEKESECPPSGLFHSLELRGAPEFRTGRKDIRRDLWISKCISFLEFRGGRFRNLRISLSSGIWGGFEKPEYGEMEKLPDLSVRFFRTDEFLRSFCQKDFVVTRNIPVVKYIDRGILIFCLGDKVPVHEIYRKMNCRDVISRI